MLQFTLEKGKRFLTLTLKERARSSGCTFCGACMTGCRVGAKNTLDKNYLHLAEQLGAEILPESKVIDVIPNGLKGDNGYEVIIKKVQNGFLPKRASKQKVLF